MIRFVLPAALAAATAGLALPASAHVVLDKRTAQTGSYYKAVFRVPHGCEGSPTTSIAVSMPAGITSAKPQVKPGWKIDVAKEKLDKPIESHHGKPITHSIASVTWSGGSLPDEYFDEFAVQLKLPDAAPGTVIYFPIVQTCQSGERRWVQVPGPGKDHLHDPAPALTLTAKP
ncbi:MAG: YcnI family protein [Hyphomicrobiales bacterium]